MTATPSTMTARPASTAADSNITCNGRRTSYKFIYTSSCNGHTYCNENGNRMADGYKFKNASDNYMFRSYHYGYTSDT